MPDQIIQHKHCGSEAYVSNVKSQNLKRKAVREQGKKGNSLKTDKTCNLSTE